MGTESKISSMELDASGEMLQLLDVQWVLKQDLDYKVLVNSSGRDGEFIEFRSVITEMLNFNDEQVFCAGIKVFGNDVIFIGANLHKVGLRIKHVLFVHEASKRVHTMREKTDAATHTVQMFTHNGLSLLRNEPQQNVTFNFTVYLGSQSSDFAYRLCDSSLQTHLWEACKSGLHWPDTTLEVVDFDVKFTAHRAILAARCPTLVAHLETKSDDSQTTLRLQGVDPESVELFLRFIYTGMVPGSFANDNLLKLAIMFKVQSLERSCKRALNNLALRDMAYLMSPPPSQYSADNAITSKDACIRQSLNSDSAAFSFEWFISDFPTYHGTLMASKTFTYEDQPLFVALIQGRSNQCRGSSFSVGIVSNSFSGYYIESVEFNYTIGCDHRKPNAAKCKEPWRDVWTELKRVKSNYEGGVCSTFWTTWSHARHNEERDFHPSYYSLLFRVRLTKKYEDYSHVMIDANWSKNMLDSCLGPFADVEVHWGGITCTAHRVVLAARSPVFREMFDAQDENTEGKVIIEMVEEVEPSTAYNFMRFLYTGTLPPTGIETTHQLRELAEIYQVDSLKKWLAFQADFPTVGDVIKYALSLQFSN